MTSAPPPGHPEINWSGWEPAGSGDVRSPCPVMNALANHSVLPHSGKGLTKALIVQALTSSINLDPGIASAFASYAITTNPDHGADFFDLDHVSKHGAIEHDVSLSRQDYDLGGDNTEFDKNVWNTTVAAYGDAQETTFETASHVRVKRFLACKAAHMAAKTQLGFGIKECFFSYGETALILGTLGGKETGKVPIDWIKIIFEQERLPYKEGWRRIEKPLTQSDMNYIIFKLFEFNEAKTIEANEVGLGTVFAVKNAVENLMPAYCTVM